MNILAFDAATNACTAALQVGDVIFSRHEIAPSQHGKLMLPMIQDLLSEANITVDQLNIIAFGCGPGSFMGVRLATATAQGLAFGLAIPVIPISTLQTLSQSMFNANVDVGVFAHQSHSTAKGSGSASDRPHLVAAAWDARMHEMYWGLYQVDQHGIMQPKQADALCTPSTIDTTTISAVACSFVGNAWGVYEKDLPALLFSKAITVQTDIYPDAKAMLAIAQSKYLNNEMISPENAHPHYLRHHVVHTTSK